MKRFLFRRGSGSSSSDGEKGQAAIEMLLIFPVFIFIVLLAVDFGVWMYQSVSVANSVREAARYGAVNCGDGSCTLTDVRERAVERSSGILDTEDVTVGWVGRDGGDPGDKGSSVIVHADHTYSFLFFFSVDVPVTACADMRLEQTDSTTSLPAGDPC